MQHAINHLVSIDAHFAAILEQYGNPNFVTRPEGFATLCKIIFEQQVSLESAKACYDKLNRLVGDFTPKNIAKCTDDQLRQCGVSRQKTKYIRALAKSILSKDIDLDSFQEKSADQIRSEMIKINGIGNWTIDVYLMFSLQSPDIIPLGDIAIVAALKELWGISDKGEIVTLTDRWKPFRTTAAFFLWHHYLKKRGRVIHP